MCQSWGKCNKGWKSKRNSRRNILRLIRLIAITVLKTDMIRAWKLLHGLRNTSGNHCLWLLCHPQMQVKAKTKPYVNINAGLRQRGKTVLCSIKVWNSFWKTWTLHKEVNCWVLNCYQHTVQKPASEMVWGWISANGTGRSHKVPAMLKEKNKKKESGSERQFPGWKCLVDVTEDWSDCFKQHKLK